MPQTPGGRLDLEVCGLVRNSGAALGLQYMMLKVINNKLFRSFRTKITTHTTYFIPPCHAAGNQKKKKKKKGPRSFVIPGMVTNKAHMVSELSTSCLELLSFSYLTTWVRGQQKMLTLDDDRAK